MVTDPIADMLTRIRNALMAGHEKTVVPSSNVKVRIAEILKEEGYISNFKVIKDHRQGMIRIYLKYIAHRKGTILGLRRMSRPGRRMYVAANKVPRVLQGMGTAIISTNKGILTDKDARKEHCGGELLCYVW